MEKRNTETLLYLARISEQSERYDDMISYIRLFIIKNNGDLSIEARNMVSIAYKNAVSSRRESWKVLHSIEQNKAIGKSDTRKEWTMFYRIKIESELELLCSDILDLLDSKLLPFANTNDTRVFFLRMKGDYYRFIYEIISDEKKCQTLHNAENAYKEAEIIAKAELDVMNPIRLGLCLNYSIFTYEILNNRVEAYRMAKQAFDDAICNSKYIEDTDYKNISDIIQLLRDRLTLWFSEIKAEESNDLILV